ncbi:hypothetical protein L7F22_035686 [Adiantum nelumboides]|nr:hypothetical protein [Adiantum nelumboides]
MRTAPWSLNLWQVLPPTKKVLVGLPSQLAALKVSILAASALACSSSRLAKAQHTRRAGRDMAMDAAMLDMYSTAEEETRARDEDAVAVRRAAWLHLAPHSLVRRSGPRYWLCTVMHGDAGVGADVGDAHGALVVEPLAGVAPHQEGVGGASVAAGRIEGLYPGCLSACLQQQQAGKGTAHKKSGAGYGHGCRHAEEETRARDEDAVAVLASWVICRRGSSNY